METDCRKSLSFIPQSSHYARGQKFRQTGYILARQGRLSPAGGELPGRRLIPEKKQVDRSAKFSLQFYLMGMISKAMIWAFLPPAILSLIALLQTMVRCTSFSSRSAHGVEGGEMVLRDLFRRLFRDRHSLPGSGGLDLRCRRICLARSSGGIENRNSFRNPESLRKCSSPCMGWPALLIWPYFETSFGRTNPSFSFSRSSFSAVESLLMRSIIRECDSFFWPRTSPSCSEFAGWSEYHIALAFTSLRKEIRRASEIGRPARDRSDLHT